MTFVASNHLPQAMRRGLASEGQRGGEIRIFATPTEWVDCFASFTNLPAEHDSFSALERFDRLCARLGDSIAYALGLRQPRLCWYLTRVDGPTPIADLERGAAATTPAECIVLSLDGLELIAETSGHSFQLALGEGALVPATCGALTVSPVGGLLLWARLSKL